MATFNTAIFDEQVFDAAAGIVTPWASLMDGQVRLEAVVSAGLLNAVVIENQIDSRTLTIKVEGPAGTFHEYSGTGVITCGNEPWVAWGYEWIS